jgi:uncharacterized cupredoxin-like copper-binding protein
MTKRVALPTLAALVVGASTIVAAPVAGGDPSLKTATRDRAGVVTVNFDEWRIDAGPAATAGSVTIDERNEGEQEHDLLIVRTDRAAADLPVGLDGVAPELAGEVVLGEVHHAHGRHAGHPHPGEHLQPGARRSRAVTLHEGTYVLLCPIPEHYERGQRSTLTVR